MEQPMVNLQETEPGVVQITMQDRDSKNGFSVALATGLLRAFKAIGENEAWKAVVLTGYDSFFASGGTKEALLSLHEGQGTFADVNLYSLAMDCPIPVISAMQGHAIGGGFVMGLYADFVVLGRECVYTTNFMKYGFTPGMGATYILSRKLGLPLAQELLLTAGTYRGAELAERGVPFRVVPRAQVLETARALARSLALKTRKSLVTLKAHLVEPLRRELPPIIEQELAMHAVTFHGAEIKDRIASMYGR